MCGKILLLEAKTIETTKRLYFELETNNQLLCPRRLWAEFYAWFTPAATVSRETIFMKHSVKEDELFAIIMLRSVRIGRFAYICQITK